MQESSVDTLLLYEYLERASWLVRENANFNYSYSGLLSYVANTYLREYALRTMPPEAAKAHLEGDIHIHNLDSGNLIPYCHGGDLLLLLRIGIRSPTITSRPAKHFSAVVDHVANYFLMSQNEFSGAQAFSDFDTIVAPFIAYDHLSYKEVKQNLQKLVYNLNFTTRQSFQSPFTNLTFNLCCPAHLEEQHVIVGGEEREDTYVDFQDEIEMVNLAMAEIYMERDAAGRPFTFPIPTVNLTGRLNWDSEALDAVFEVDSKLGTYYFMNYLGSGIPENTMRSMCCRLLIDLSQLSSPKGLFTSEGGTGSIGVVSLNMARLGYLARDEADFFDRLDRLLEIAREYLMFKSEMIERSLAKGLMPFAQAYGFNPDRYFRTIGVIGLNEMCVNFLGEPLSESVDFVEEVLLHIGDRLREFQMETGKLWNLEETPGEGASYRLAKIDRERYPGIYTKGSSSAPYYTTVLIPTDEDIPLAERLEIEGRLLPLFSGGTVFRIHLGEPVDATVAKKLIRRIAENYRIPYIDLAATFSVCPREAYMIHGVYEKCPRCGGGMEIYARVVGYYRPVYKWNPGKQAEFRDRILVGSSYLSF